MNHRSGLLSLSDKVRAAGRGRDTVLAHITPEEAALLKERGGRGSTNPVTGLLEFEDDFSYNAPMDFGYSAPSYSYSLPDLYTPPSNDYYSQNYGGVLPIDYGSNAILNNANQSSYATINDIYNNNINNLSNGLNNYSPVVNTPIDYSYLNPVAPPTTVTDYYDPGYNYDYGNVAPIQTPVTTPTQPSQPDYAVVDSNNPPQPDYAVVDPNNPPQPDYAVVDPNNPPQPPQMYEPSPIQYNDPTASYRYDILGNLSPDAFYRSQFAPEFANEIYSNVSPNFSVDEQGNPTAATGTTTGNVTTAPLAGDFVDAQGNLITDTVGGLRPGVDLSAEAEPTDGGDSAYSALYEKVPSYKSGPDYTVRGPMRGLDGLTEQDKKALLGTAVAESSNNQDEMNAIMNVIRNRAESTGKSVYDVVTERRQFSPWDLKPTDPNYPLNITESHPRYALAEKGYEDVFVNGMNNVGTAKNFYALGAMETGEPPKFGSKGYPDVTIGKTTVVATPGNSLEYTPPTPPMPMARPTDEQFAMYNPGSEYSAPLPPGRPTAEEFAAYSTPPALPPMITGVGNSAYNLPRGIMSYAEQPTPPANIPTQTGETPDANAVTSPSLMDRAIKAAPGAAVDFGLSSLIPFYGPASLAAKVFGIETPGSMLGSNLTGGFANYPKSATATEYVPPVEAPAEIGKLPQTAGGTPIISYPAEGPVQVPPDSSGQVTGRSANPTSTYDSAAPSAVPYSSPFGTGTYALPGGTQGMSYNAPGSPGADIVSALAEPSDGAPVPKEYQAPFAAPDRSYILPEELAFAGKPEAGSLEEFAGFNPPGQSYELPGYVARAGEPQPYSPPYQPIDKKYALPEELANIGRPATPSPLDYANPDKKYALPPNLGGVSPPGLTRAPTVEQQRIPAPGPMALPASGGYSPSGGGISNFGGGGGGGGGPSISVGGGGGGGGSRAAAAPTGGGSLGTVSASNFGFQGIGGINRDYRSPVVESGRTVDFGTPSRQLAYDLNLPAIQQAAMNPNSYRNYLSQYKQLFG
jgi:hypothetical protein